MKKKFISAILCGVLGISMISGCGSSEGDKESQGQTASKSAADSGDVVEITFWDNYADTIRTELYGKLISQFEEENPGIKVKYVPLPADQAKSKYDVAIQSETTPDCGVTYQYWLNDFIVQDALLPLDDYMSSWDKKDELLETFQNSIKEMSPDGKTYGLAQTVTIPAVWYNTDIFTKADTEIPQSWDEILAAVEKTTDKENGVYGFSIRGGAGSSQQFEQMMYQYSGITEMFDENGNSTINDPAHVEFLDKFAKLYNVYTPESDITNAVAEMNAAFDSGSAGMIFHNLGSYGQHVQTLGEDGFAGLVRLNAVNGTRTIVSNGAMCLSVFKDSKHPAEAFKFVSFLAQHEACSYISEQIGQIPCNKEALEDDWVQKAGPIKEAADALLDPGTTVTTLPINVIGYYDLHQNTLVEGFQNVLLGNMTAQEYLDSWASEMTRLKAEYDQYLQSK